NDGRHGGRSANRQRPTRLVGGLAPDREDWHDRGIRAGRDRAAGKSVYHWKYPDGGWGLDGTITNGWKQTCDELMNSPEMTDARDARETTRELDDAKACGICTGGSDTRLRTPMVRAARENCPFLAHFV